MVINSSGTDRYTNGVVDIHRTADSVQANSLGEDNAIPDIGAIDGASQTSLQAPIAVVGMACRLPNDCHSPEAFWRFIERGSIAKNRPPPSRFNIDTHYDGSLKNKTMASPGGMFLQGIDVQDIDAQFFKLPRLEAMSMDPQQRQLLEVVYEGLENAGVTLEQLDESPVGCFVGSFACDYGDMQARDPENRGTTTTVGIGRAMLSNRISHFLNIKGPSMTIDTACSGTLTGVDIASRYLQTREINGAIVAGANIYLSPEHVMDHHFGANGTASLSGKCHTFDAKADGYIKAEAVNMVYLKRLDDALRDGDPIRAVLRGTATGSDGWTAGIASPNSQAQATAVRQAYANAGISDLSLTSYIECHGTGTKAGDVIEVNGIASVFSKHRTPDNPLRIGSVKSNIGHSEPAAGISGLLKTILALERGVIPGNPTFLTPNPNIDFDKLCLRPSQATTNWPAVPFRRASVNSFGYGGSNAHVIVDAATGLSKHVTSYTPESDDIFADDAGPERPYLLVLSANDENSLRAQVTSLDKHLSDPAVGVKIRDLAHTLSNHRTRHYHRGYLIANSNSIDVDDVTMGTPRSDPPRIGFVFTGQGAQWVQMGKDLITFPVAKRELEHLDNVLGNLSEPPQWSLIDKLVNPQSAEDLRDPELSQPLVTALQLAILAVLDGSGVKCSSVVGHSSGEIAAAVMAGRITAEQAIKIAYYRGKATSNAQFETEVGMLATGLGAESVQPYLKTTSIQIACINSPDSVTLSGVRSELQTVEQKIKADGHFARLLLVNAAYHSRHMNVVADEYQTLLERHVNWQQPSFKSATMISSTSGEIVEDDLGPSYWVRNMVSPVLFSQAIQRMISPSDGVDLLIEIGPSNALSGPINQIKKAVSSSVDYIPSWKRGADALNAMLGLAGQLFIIGCPIQLAQVNKDTEAAAPSLIVDLPNYPWNHATKYWQESEASSDWRFRKFAHHDLLGTKVLGTPWTQPVWKKAIKVDDLPWLRDHKLGDSVVFPASGYIAMAIEAIFQKAKSLGRIPDTASVNQVSYKLRNITFFRALTVDEESGNTQIMLSLNPCTSTKDSWHEFKISSISKEVVNDHCQGLVSLSEEGIQVGPASDLLPLLHSTPASTWYKAMRDVGYSFGPSFQQQLQIESTAGQRSNRATVSLLEPQSKTPQSLYSMHPVSIDSCFQAGAPSVWAGHRSSVNILMLPATIDDLTVMAQASSPETGLAVADAEYTGVGRHDDPRRLKSNVKVYDPANGNLLFRLSGLHYHSLDATVERHAAHTYTCLEWQPDVSFLSDNKLDTLLEAAEFSSSTAQAVAKIGQVVNLVAHKNPRLRLFELSLIDKPESVWLDCVKPVASDIATDLEYRLSLPSQNSALSAQSKYGSSNVEFGLHDIDAPFSEMEDRDTYEIIILKASPCHPPSTSHIEKARNHLSHRCFLFVVYDTSTAGESLSKHDGLESTSTAQPPKDAGELQIASFESTIAKEAPQPRVPLHVTHFKASNGLKSRTLSDLVENGWEVIEHFLPFNDVPENGTVVVLDEMHSPVMSNLSDEQFESFRNLVQRQCRILWVTRGAQMQVTHPEHALFFGTARSLYGEDPTSLIMVLDVEHADGPASLGALHSVLERLVSAQKLQDEDHEFIERGGIVYISRIVPDKAVNQAEKDSILGPEPRQQSLHGHQSTVRLISTRAGTIDSLQYAEQPDEEFGNRDVEIEVHAAALNFKDLAHALGFFPSNERRFGIECAGIVTRRGNDVGSVSVGDRVVLVRKDGGAFGNRVIGMVEGVQRIPDWMSFVDASTFGICFMTAMYSLINLANTQAGQTVLIHAGAGGVGLAAIQICRHLQAEIYVTVGSEEKRRFLRTEYGIPEDRMFSSRSISFSSDLMSATNGRGADVILNSLAGDMLHESWRCLAPNGNFIEIGKKDLIDRNSISLAPFSRNASYRSFDLQAIPMPTFDRLMKQMVAFANDGIIKPLPIYRTFSSGDIANAFRCMRDGKHIGKIVVSDGNRDDVRVPVIPAAPVLKLRDNVSYLIAGGFKGLCGSLALYLARIGAKNIAVMSRSGYEDSASQRIIYHLKAMGTHVDLIQGDICDVKDVRRAFASTNKPVGGIIQGAMVLRDKMFTWMTPDEFRTPIAPKVVGTWNLHNLAIENNLELDFFTLLSSVSGVAGQKAQTNYCAGNVFQDSFAVYRHSLGLPACSVNLGVVEDVGYFTEHDDLSRRLESQGWTPINEALLHKILRFSILQQTTSPINQDSISQLITGIPVPLLPASPLQPSHRWSALRATAAATGAMGGNSQDSHLVRLKNAAASPSEDLDHPALVASAVEVVNAVLMRSLGLQNPLEEGRPLASYGIDSLVAVELRNWTRSELGIEITALDIVGAKTLGLLCELILKRLLA
ncbi:polyketide synthase [Penicillium mononematosum]|uniref:polyketide synthase n=1 Tax=Penicillium mononematosum TaxID=268346 RepID=UPI0025482537|nr:polyketide synthase [Penicillium mononematosum]KAJ6190988.1 polyketide synthase [Penicillium mononematosum]